MKFYELVCVEHEADYKIGKCDQYKVFDTLREARACGKKFASEHPDYDVIVVRLVEFRELQYRR